MNDWSILHREQLTFLGLFFIAMGTGGIKPCVSAFGGDQFKLPQQEVYLSTFFSMFYLAINCGSLTSTALTPILREDVKCFGEKNCFSLAFLVPAILMIIAIGKYLDYFGATEDCLNLKKFRFFETNNCASFAFFKVRCDSVRYNS